MDLNYQVAVKKGFIQDYLLNLIDCSCLLYIFLVIFLVKFNDQSIKIRSHLTQKKSKIFYRVINLKMLGLLSNLIFSKAQIYSAFLGLKLLPSCKAIK